jgi:glycosyltransferase involved in cell wall biosynthesis
LLTAVDDMPLRVLYVGPLPPARGGSETVAHLVLRGLHARGAIVHGLAALPISLAGRRLRAWPATDDVGRSIRRYPVPTVSSVLELGSSDPTYRAHEDREIARRLPRLLRDARPDVVLIGRESLAWSVPDIVRDHGVPSVLQVHGGMTLSGLLDGTAGSFVGLRGHIEKVDLVVAVAHHMAAALRSRGLPRVAVVENPVDLESFAPRMAAVVLRRRLTIPAGASVMLHASNLTGLKRPLDIVDAAAIALQRDSRLCFVVVGDGALRAAMEAAVARRRLQDAFRFAGWVDHARMPDYINLADGVLMPSVREGQSLVYLETQACGRILIASDIPAAREVVVHGQTGLLFRLGDVADLAAKILITARDGRLRTTIGTDARAAAASHSADRVAAAYDALLRRVAARGLTRGVGRRASPQTTADDVLVDGAAPIPRVMCKDVRDGGFSVPASMGRRLDRVG